MKKLQFLKILVFLLLCTICSVTEANVLDHLKKAEGKSGNHSIRNIDFIYMINLDQRPEKYDMSIEQLHPYGIYPYRFSAVNGWEISLETVNDVGVKYSHGMNSGFMATSYLLDGDFQPYHEKIQTIGQTYFCHCMSRGAIGCALSHISVLKDAYDSGYETIWVMEDDIEVLQDPRVVSDLVEELDKVVGENEWDILFTDRDIRGGNGEYVPCAGMANRPNFKSKNMSRFYINAPINKTFRRLGARFGATSMIIRRSGIEKLLNFFETYQLYHPYDMDYYAPEGMRMLTVLKDVIGNIPGGISDSGGPNYLNK